MERRAGAGGGRKERVYFSLAIILGDKSSLWITQMDLPEGNTLFLIWREVLW